MICHVRVIPRAKSNKIAVDADGKFKAHTTAAPVDGKANEAVVKLLAGYFGVPKSHIKIVKGETARDKIFSVDSKENFLLHDGARFI